MGRWQPGMPFRLNLQSRQARGLVGLYTAFSRPGPGVLRNLVAGRPQVAAVSGPTLTADADFGAVATVNGTSYFLAAATPLAAAPLSFAVWGRITDASAERVMVSIANGGSTNNFFALGVENAAGDPIGFTSRSGSGTAKAITTTGVTVGQWFHAAGTTSAANARAAYLNGASKGTNTTSITPSGPTRVGVGVLARSALDVRWVGDVAEVRIYNRALSDEDVLELYDPDTRWDLYAPLGRTLYALAATPPAPTVGSTLTPMRGVIGP